ncbi:MAG: transporter [Betaproteobacteria bacterium]|nr:transporter [Betaproteobacteria bacterium]
MKFLIAAFLAFIAVPSIAQTYPARTIRFIVPVPPGGGADAVARLLAPRLSELLGQQVIVDNRAGGNATIGAEQVAKSPPDGYTWLLGTSQHTVTPSIVKQVPYDIAADFAPVTLVVRAPQLLMVHPLVPAKTTAQLIALARKQPGRLNYGSGGLGSASHLAAAVFSSMAGISITHIPYKGVGLAFVDLIGGQLDLSFPAIPSGVPYHRSGRLRALGVTSLKRHASIPDVPTIAEDALLNYQVQSWYGVLVPAGTRADIVSRINTAFTTALKAPETKAALVAQGGDPDPGTPEEFGRLIKDELARNAKITRAAGIVPE